MNYDEKIKNWRRKEEGAVAIIVAFAMIGLMASAALAIDLGMASYKISKLQNAMDSAALAAVQELPAADTSSPEWTSATAIATEYAQKNGIDHVTISPVYRSGKIVGAQATSDTLVEYTFAKVLGKESGTYNRDATAEKQPVSQTVSEGIVPLAAWEELMTTNGGIQPGQTVSLKVGVDGQKEYPGSGWFGALSLGGTGADNYKDNLINGYHGDEVYPGAELTTENGNMSGPTIDGMQTRIGSDACTYDEYAATGDWPTMEECPRIVIVPIVYAFDYSGHYKVKVRSFAAFFIETFTEAAGKTTITGRYIPDYTISGNTKTDTTISDYGVNAIKLVE